MVKRKKALQLLDSNTTRHAFEVTTTNESYDKSLENATKRN
jgi:hypothetical protein